MHGLMSELYPICRSITGKGVEKTLRIIRKHVPIKIRRIPTGKKVFDWTVPQEWNIQDAYIRNSKGEKIVDIRKSNLHVVNYAAPIHQKMTLAELKRHIHTIPEHPDWIPYVTSYYEKKWGFCMAHRQFKGLVNDTYEVKIDSRLSDGHLTYGELYIKGQSEEEVLFSTYLCHPSLCNDNLSGVVLSTFLAKILGGKALKHSYRFLFVPETIGSIAWLSLNEEKLGNIKHGLVVTCVGDPGKMTYKRSRRRDAEIDRIVSQVLKESGKPHETIDFFPYGSDERQYCSPGFNLPVGSLMRTPYGRFPEYHTSADDLRFVSPEYLADSLMNYLKVVDVIEQNITYANISPKCEPQLGKRGLYSPKGGDKRPPVTGILWVLNMSDGTKSLLDIAAQSGLRFEDIKAAADALRKKRLIVECERLHTAP